MFHKMTITRPRKRALLDQKHRRENKIGSERMFKKELNSCRKVKAYPTFPCLTPVDFMEEPREVIHLGSNNREPQDRHSAFPGEVMGLSKPQKLSRSLHFCEPFKKEAVKNYLADFSAKGTKLLLIFPTEQCGVWW